MLGQIKKQQRNSKEASSIVHKGLTTIGKSFSQVISASFAGLQF